MGLVLTLVIGGIVGWLASIVTNKNAAVILVGAAALVLLGGRPAASPVVRGSDGGGDLVGGLAPVSSPDGQDNAIRRVFQDVLRREPTNSELRRYRARMEDDHWTEEDIGRNLRSRGDYRSHTGGRDSDVDRIVRRAYEDILNRQLDPEGLRSYRRAMIDKGWTEQDVREDLRKSPEYANQERQSAERIVRRAYQDILQRQPDSSGLRTYGDQILNHDWDEDDVREALMRSPEHKQRNGMTRERAEDIVRRAYQNVLRREADEDGLQGYVDRVLRDRWSQAQVESELRKSDEYRNRRR